ncbi:MULTISPECIES: hypothetical protein [Paraburkholderia]|uniref:hypothetical protein n=1 Tax=Paraburkholderia TaxID=1822464 RepID=UPI00224DF69C|nr:MULTISPECIES: hypothetical protein [Paraburkholderia]MCX4154968.1 hypothetical protein [Paraburkholderia aspalathi]MDN7164379.1 hypothetical protein [Paraburkholderia sp. SECH2]MDQ6392864.1 hypothetical protein [Paraburkholderia aspalathi]
MRRRSERHNEVKTGLTDRVYDAMQQYKVLQGIESDSAALARIAELMLLGVVGNLPANLLDRIDETSQSGTRMAA